MKLLVVGLGSIGRRHAENLMAMGHEIIGCDQRCGIDAEFKYPGLDVFVYTAELEQGLAEKPDGVLICSPPWLHKSQAIQAIESGYHVFCEKPLALTRDDALEIHAAARQHGRALQVGYQLRFMPSVQRLALLVREGHVGRVYHARAEFGCDLRMWRPTGLDNYGARKAEGGGVLLDASHDLDVLTWLFGTPQMVACIGRTTGLVGEMDVEDCADLTIGWGFTLGSVHLDYLSGNYHRRLIVMGTKSSEEWHYDAREGASVYISEIRYFLETLEGKTHEQDAEVSSGIEALAIVDAAKESAAKRGEWARVAADG